MSEEHPANACHQCGETMDGYEPPQFGTPGVGVCPEHGVSYDRTYVGPGSIYS